MNLRAIVHNARKACEERRRRHWRAQLVGLNIRIAQLERVRRESRPIRMAHPEVNRYLAVESPEWLVGRRRKLAKRLGISESLAACILK